MTRPTTKPVGAKHEEDSKRRRKTGEEGSTRRMRTGVRGGPVHGEQEDGGRRHHSFFSANKKTEL